MSVSDLPKMTIATQPKSEQQKHSSRLNQASPLHSSSDSHLSVSAQNDSPSSSGFAKPRKASVKKRLTNSRSIVKRLGQRPARDQHPAASQPETHHHLTPHSNYHENDRKGDTTTSPSSSSGTQLARKKLSKSTSFVRPVGVRTRLTCSKPKLLVISQDSNLDKATCSSKFKSTVFPDGDEPQLLETTAAGSHMSLSNNKKVCPYTYCTLHGAGRSQGPHLKRLGSVKKPVSRTYKHKAIKSRGGHEQLETKPSQAYWDKHASNTTKSISSNDVHMKNKAQGKAKTMDRAKWDITSQHHPLKDDHSNCVSQNSEAPQVTKEETNEDYKLSNISSCPENEKTTRIWRLIYHSMLSAKYRSELYPGVNTESQVHNVAAPTQAITLEAQRDETLNTGMQTVENPQMDAIKLVEDAIDELFLPEVDEMLWSKPPTFINRASEKDLNESQQHDTSCMVDHCSIGNREEDTMKYVGTDSVKEARSFSKEGSESFSKNWSRLKQVVLLKRFVKALDKVRELRFKDPQLLNSVPNPEMEKVNLKHQTLDEKRLADEWMLDYALRQAVAKLTPARRKKVELLIEAFETVIPLTKNETPRSPHQPLSTYTVSSVRLCTENTLLSSGPFKEVDQEHAGSVLFKDLPPLPIMSSPKPKHKSEEVASRHYDDEFLETTEMKNSQSSVLSLNSINESSESGKKTVIVSDSNHGTVEESPLLNASGKPAEDDAQAQLDNKKYFKMWGMIYNHVVSGSAAEIGSQLHIIESTDSREAADSKLDAVKLVEDALDEMLLPEYQDQSSDDQSITSDRDHLEMVHSENGDSEISIRKDFVSDYFKDFNQMKAKTAGETWRKADITTHTKQPHMAENGGSKTIKLRANGWSNLKKFILLKRFIRALDKLKKINPTKPKYLCPEPDGEPEEVSLKRQSTGDRLSADQWMIDHAIQQVVARLTPARKRRVELLVEAFESVEAVLPLSNSRTPLIRSMRSATRAELF
uniref:Calmodulin-binding domain-containing protein n=2 Tax=Kalanchoe fedtschenkoi TaxID=63787 RepID=A0A7N0VF77_KALFE